jgi:hypothetical protein
MQHNREILERDLRIALTLKADDLFFTVGGEEGERLQEQFLGTRCEGLASDSLHSPAALAEINLDRFEIADQVISLHGMLETRSLGLKPHQHQPDVDSIRQEALDFFEHFLSTLPKTALGGWDATSVRSGPLLRFYEDCATWANFVEAINDVFYDGPDLHSLRVVDLALLSGLEVRTIRNRVGPSRPIRTTPERRQRESGLSDAAFVGVNTLDVLDWLAQRRDFSICRLDPAWVQRRVEAAREPLTVSRSAIVLGLLTIGSISKIASELGWAEKQVKDWAEEGPSGTAEDARALAKLVGLDPDSYATRCANSI